MESKIAQFLPEIRKVKQKCQLNLCRLCIYRTEKVCYNEPKHMYKSVADGRWGAESAHII